MRGMFSLPLTTGPLGEWYLFDVHHSCSCSCASLEASVPRFPKDRIAMLAQRETIEQTNFRQRKGKLPLLQYITSFIQGSSLCSLLGFSDPAGRITWALHVYHSRFSCVVSLQYRAGLEMGAVAIMLRPT